MKEETKNIVVCPKHGNKEYDVKPPHYCKNKIGEGCNCICTCHLEEKKCPAQSTKECEEDHDGFYYYCERNMPSPSDKTWELGKLVGKTVYSVSESDEVVEISFRNQETRADKITMRFYSELTSATIKAKEEVLNDVIDIISRAGGGGGGAFRNFIISQISSIQEYAKVNGINLEEPKS